jgi:RNA polymerase sigma factor (TIGR02999 family)
MPAAREDLTRHLLRATAGDAAAQEQLLPLVYGELRRLADALFAGRRSTLQPTMLVHDAFLRLVGQDVPWQGRRHFFAVAAAAMRQILAGNARRRLAEKRGGDRLRVTLSGAELPAPEGALDMAELDEALQRLAAVHERCARVVELKFFAGLQHREIADLLAVSVRTIELDWRTARAWLRRELSPPRGAGG